MPNAMLRDETLHARIRAEYQEMPGLRLTTAQAARLFNLDPNHCRQTLESLVSAGTLWTNGREFLATNVGRQYA
jgi:hypothetical protein